jgi:hypothetical protein
MKFFIRYLPKSPLFLIFILAVLVLAVVTCGKKASPLPPIPIVPVAPSENRMRQSGDQFLYLYLLPIVNTDGTPAEISKIEIYKLTDPRVGMESTQTQTQTAPTQTQPQTQTAQTQTAQTQFLQTQTAQTQTVQTQTSIQTQTFPLPQTSIQTQLVGQTQTSPQTSAENIQTQTSPQTQTQTGVQSQFAQSQSQSQTQPQTQKKPEDAREIEEKEFKSRSEKVLEIPGDQIQGYVRDGYFVFVQKLNLQPDSEELKNWSYYASKIYSKKGKSAGFTKTVALFPAVVPKAPSNFTATIDEQGVHLTWKPVDTDIFGRPLPEGSVTYNVYRGKDASFVPLEPINTESILEPSYKDSSPLNGQANYYFVRAHDSLQKKQQESAPSNVILIFAQDTFAPTAPQELNVVSAREGMVLIWAPNPEKDIAGYNIYRSLTPGTDYKKVNEVLVRETTYTDTTATGKEKYYYVITAVDNAPVPNESPYSSEVSEVPRNK